MINTIEDVIQFLDDAKSQPEYFDKEDLEEIEYFLEDGIRPSAGVEIIKKCMELFIKALVKQGKLKEITRNGIKYYKFEKI